MRAGDNKIISLVAGLGNPGNKYSATRHNAGAWFVDIVCQKYALELKPAPKFFADTVKFSVDNHELWMIIPHDCMNLNGKAVAAIANFYKIPPAEILIVHDELDINPGEVRLKQGGGTGGHNGLRSVESALGSRDFLRLRIGIGHPGDKSGVTSYVLSKPGSEDREKIMAELAQAAASFKDIVTGSHASVMNELNRRKRV